MDILIFILVSYICIAIMWILVDPYTVTSEHVVWWPIYLIKWLFRSLCEALKS